MAVSYRLATMSVDDRTEAALWIGERLYPFSEAGAALRGVALLDVFRAWDRWQPLLQATADRHGEMEGTSVGAATLLTPLQYPANLLAVGANYSGHLKEMGLVAQKWASMPFFLRPPRSSLVGPGATVVHPRSTKQFDWECELAVVIGRPLRHATRAEAAAAIAGYAVGLDLSCRDLIPADNDLKVDLLRGKAQDTMAPMGPAIVPASFVADPYQLRITLDVEGQRMMDASTDEMLYRIDEQLSIISGYMSLEPGDVLFTGSPSGSAGVHGNRWLKPGDRIRAEIQSVGVLEVSVRSDLGEGEAA